MKYVEKCPKCKGEVQTKSLKKSIGLGIIKIPVSQFCLNPSCDWFQDFSEAKNPEDLNQDVLQLNIPYVKNKMPGLKRQIAELKKKNPNIIKQNMLVVKGAVAVIIFSILLILLLSLLHN